ncbi:hypothetical protein KIPB_013139, partial [Kipferlia bialata]
SWWCRSPPPQTHCTSPSSCRLCMSPHHSCPPRGSDG